MPNRPPTRAWDQKRAAYDPAAIVLGVLIVSLVGTGFYLAHRAKRAYVSVDAETLCPKYEPPKAVTIILLDTSDSLSETQRLRLETDLKNIHHNVPKFGLLEIYAVGTTPGEVVYPVLALCNPGDGSDVSEFYQNPSLARKKWTEFERRLSSELNRLLAAKGTDVSPIMEAIQATSLRTFGRSELANVPRKLVVVSDLLQNVPGGFSQYGGIGEFANFRRTAYFSKVRSVLTDVEVSVFYLVRPTSPQKWPEHRLFWEEYFHSQGATLERLDPVYGAQ
jgi:hypothetical protein